MIKRIAKFKSIHIPGSNNGRCNSISTESTKFL